jgi:hypothetical protein
MEALDAIFYMGFSDRARLFWRRAGARGEKLASSGKSVILTPPCGSLGATTLLLVTPLGSVRAPRHPVPFPYSHIHSQRILKTRLR